MNNKQTESLFQDRLPEEILKELTPEVRRQYFLWDEIMKRQLELYPWLILPVIKEVFHKEYPADRNIVLLSTEYTVSRIHEKGEKLLHAIRSDLLLKLERDLYHFECQIEKDGKMVFRMLEYDVHIALTHGKGARKAKNEQGRFEVSFPKSAVLYLGNEKNVPEYEACTLHFQDGTTHLYKVPVIRVQGYSPECIEEKHLNILVPFLPIRFRDQIKKISEAGRKDTEPEELTVEEEAKRKAAREALKQEMAGFILQCMTVLQHEKERGVFSEIVRKDIGEFLWKASGYLLEEDDALYREVSAKVEPAIKLSREIIAELEDDIKGLQESNRELLNNNKELYQERENACRRLVEKVKGQKKSEKEAVEDLMLIFGLSEEAAKEKTRAYWGCPTCP